MKIVIHDSIETKAYNEVVTSLVSYNLRFTKSFDSIESSLEILVYNSDDVIIAGAYGRSHWGTMEIQTFVVDENYRNKGIGKQLMNAVISEAINRKCTYISLDTLSFQAPEFYKKFDFNIIGEEYNEYYNFSKIYLRKTL